MKLCDEMGFYVIDETDLETHGLVAKKGVTENKFDAENIIWLCTNPDFLKMFVEKNELYGRA